MLELPRRRAESQEGKWFKSYDKTRELAVATKTAGDKAVADAVAGRDTPMPSRPKRRRCRCQGEGQDGGSASGGKSSHRSRSRTSSPYTRPLRIGACRRGGHDRSEIGPDGKIIDAKVVRSIPLLDQAALDAVRQWEYTPTLLNGVPVPVVVT